MDKVIIHRVVVYARDPKDGSVIGIVCGESYCLPIVTDCQPELLNQLNSGAPKDVVESYVAGMNLGWDHPAAQAAVRFHKWKTGGDQ